jgi:hypothetical protein
MSARAGDRKRGALVLRARMKEEVEGLRELELLTSWRPNISIVLGALIAVFGLV